MTQALQRAGSLEDVIDTQIELGHGDPHSVYQAVVRMLGDELEELVRPHIEEFVCEMARQRLNSRRRSSIAKINRNTVKTEEVKLRYLWVPGDGEVSYKRIADMTAADFIRRADYIENMASGLMRHAKWCRDVAALMAQENVRKAGKLTTLPAVEEIET